MHSDFPKISIITPSLNQVDFLESTIQSILSQKYPNLEYIVVDGGSTDGSLKIIKKYEKYLHFWCSEPDAGHYDAINKGFAHSTGEIMTWLNSDDMHCSWSLETVASIFSEIPQVEWLTTLNPGTWDYQGFCMGFGLIAGYSKEAFLDGCYLPPTSNRAIGWIQQESTFWRRSLWEKSGGYISTEFKLAGDFDLWSRFYSHTDLYGTTSPLAGFRRQLGQRSRQIEKYVLEAEMSLNRFRVGANWSSSIRRQLALNFNLHKIPKVKRLFNSLYSYLGKRVVRKQLDSPDGYWEVEEYRFY